VTPEAQGAVERAAEVTHTPCGFDWTDARGHHECVVRWMDHAGPHADGEGHSPATPPTASHDETAAAVAALESARDALYRGEGPDVVADSDIVYGEWLGNRADLLAARAAAGDADGGRAGGGGR
jgi:hypothetical protein